jgi:hypothetical protein
MVQVTAESADDITSQCMQERTTTARCALPVLVGFSTASMDTAGACIHVAQVRAGVWLVSRFIRAWVWLGAACCRCIAGRGALLSATQRPQGGIGMNLSAIRRSHSSVSQQVTLHDDDHENTIFLFYFRERWVFSPVLSKVLRTTAARGAICMFQ